MIFLRSVFRHVTLPIPGELILDLYDVFDPQEPYSILGKLKLIQLLDAFIDRLNH